ncbi:hypothetical protein GGH96_000145 [Coemansia sp. RSA 1972]|nr:hypothetical protein GGH96_000145 [Coemansia sp. RSA 1972]
MALVLNTKSNASRVLKLVLCPNVPIDLRVCLVTMVARWSIVLAQTQGFMPCIVDVFCQRTGRVPQLEFLPRVPKDLLVQDTCTDSAYFYMPKDVASVAPSDAAEQLSTCATHSDLDPTTPTLDLPSMHACALELHKLGTHLTNTLRTMRANKDPELDPLVQTTTMQLNTTYTQLLDHSRALNTVYSQTNSVLQMAADEATQSLAFYSTAIQCHKDWVGNTGDCEGQAGGSNYAQKWQINEPVNKVGLERVSTKARGKMPAD